MNRAEIDLSDYAKPDIEIPCKHCTWIGHNGARTPPDDDCPKCLGSGLQLCYDIGQPGCLGYATAEDGEYVCSYHLEHHHCGARYLKHEDYVLCVRCDVVEIAERFPDLVVVQIPSPCPDPSIRPDALGGTA